MPSLKNLYERGFSSLNSSWPSSVRFVHKSINRNLSSSCRPSTRIFARSRRKKNSDIQTMMSGMVRRIQLAVATSRTLKNTDRSVP